MSNQRPVYCWDTCVFLAHFKKEPDKPLDDILAVLDEVVADKADLIVSITTRMEILDVVEDKDLANELAGFLQRRNVMLVDVNPPVADAVLKIRYKASKGTPKRNIKVPDAQILATAMVYGADVLHTFDPPILNLDRSSIVNGLSIKHPCLLSGQKLLKYLREGPTQGVFQRHLHRYLGPSRFGRIPCALEIVHHAKTLENAQ